MDVSQAQGRTNESPLDGRQEAALSQGDDQSLDPEEGQSHGSPRTSLTSGPRVPGARSSAPTRFQAGPSTESLRTCARTRRRDSTTAPIGSRAAEEDIP